MLITADHDKRVLIDVDTSKAKFDETTTADAQLVTKDLMVKAGLNAYDKTEVRDVTEIYSRKSIFTGHVNYAFII